jgi:hypothetical protein
MKPEMFLAVFVMLAPFGEPCFALSLNELYYVDHVTDEKVYTKKNHESSLKTSDELVDKYPIYVWKFTVKKPTDNFIFVVTKNTGDYMLTNQGPVFQVATGSSKKVKMGLKSCRGGDFAVIEIDKFPRRKNTAFMEQSDLLRAVTLYHGEYILDLPYGETKEIRRWIEFHGKVGDSIIIYFMVYDTKETMARGALDFLGAKLVGKEDYAAFKEINNMIKAATNNSEYQIVYKKVMDEAKGGCRKIIDIPLSGALCQHLLDSNISFKLIEESNSSFCVQ